MDSIDHSAGIVCHHSLQFRPGGDAFLLFLYDVQTVTPLAVGTGTILALFITIKLWRHIRMKTIRRLLISGLFGLPFLLTILIWVKNDILVIVLGAVLIGFSVFKIASPQTVALKSDGLSYISGFFSGILGVVYNIPAPHSWKISGWA